MGIVKSLRGASIPARKIIGLAGAQASGGGGGGAVLGDATESLTTAICGGNFAAGSLIGIKDGLIVLASNSNNVECIGILTEASITGQYAKILTAGRFYLSTFNFNFPADTNHELFLGVNGVITKTPPTASGAFIQKIGDVVDNNSLFLSLGVALYLI